MKNNLSSEERERFFNQKVFQESLEGLTFLSLIKKLTSLEPEQRPALEGTLSILQSMPKLIAAKAQALEEIETLRNEIYGPESDHLSPTFLCKKIELSLDEDELTLNYNKALQYLTLKKEQLHLKSILLKIKAFQFGENDKKMEVFYSNTLVRIYTSSQPEALDQIQEELKDRLAELHENQKIIEEIKSKIQEIRASSRFYTVGRKAHAREIEAFFSELDVQDRHRLKAFSMDPLSHDLLPEQAERRHHPK